MELSEWENLASLLSLAAGLLTCALLGPNAIRVSILRRVTRVARWTQQHPLVGVAFAPLLSLGFSVMLAVNRGLPQPGVQDEASYLLAADTFAHGRVTNPTPPMWEHFETPHQLMHPSYMTKYPPGQAIAMAAGQLLTGEPIAGVWMSAALAVAAIHWMLRGLLPESWALLGAVVAATQTFILEWSQNYWGGCVAVLGSALLLGGWVRLVKSPSIRADIGAALGLIVLANSRPFEGLVFSLAPVLMLVTNRKLWRARLVVWPVALLLLGAAAMGYYNYRVTGSALRMPFVEYARQYDIYPKFWFLPTHPAPVYRNASQQFVHEVYEQTGYAVFRNWHSALYEMRDRISSIYLTCIGFAVLLVPLGVGLISTAGPVSRGLRIALALTVVGLETETFVQAHYIAPLLPALLLITLLGWRKMHGWRFHNRAVGPVIAVAIAVGCFAGSAMELARHPYRDPMILNQKMVIDRFPQLQTGRHLIFVNACDMRIRTLYDLVHNLSDIEDSRIIWARTLDYDSDQRLIAAFPQRQVWLLNVAGDLSLQTVTMPTKTSVPANAPVPNRPQGALRPTASTGSS